MRSSRFHVSRWMVVLGGALALLLPGARDSQGQSPPERLWSECATTGGAAVSGLCADAALALQALHSGMGGLLVVGGPLPTGPSTLGHRTEGSPRIVVDVGTGWASFKHPDLARRPGAGGGREARSTPLSGRLTGVVGVFPGFSPLPTVGGVLSLDAVVMLQAVGAPSSPGSPGTRFGWGAGVRAGVFRESFSLPGVTLSAMHHRLGELSYGLAEGPGALATLSPRTTSLRLTAGKELWPIGVSGGVGWDRYRGDGRIVARPEEGAAPQTTRRRDLEMDRRYLFGGVSYTWLVTQVAAEVTWARAATPLAELDGTSSFTPGGGELQGAVSFRIRY